MIATTSIYPVGSSLNVCRSPTFGFAGKIQESGRRADASRRLPLTTNVTSFKVHIRSTQGLPSADVEPTKAHFDPERDRLMLFSDLGWPVSLCQLRCGKPSLSLSGTGDAFGF